MTNIDDATFSEKVLKSKRPVLVDFWAPWCGPCRQIKPHLEKIGMEYEGRADVVLVNTDENPELASAWGVSGLPSLMMFKDGSLVSRRNGSMSPPEIKSLIEDAITA